MAGGIDVDVPGDGVRLRATRWAGGGVPVLLLHGLASSRRFWNLVVPGLLGAGAGGTVGPAVVALDSRGHGESEQPEDGYDTASVVRDLLPALDALGLSRVVVVGHSWGAWIALALAATHPERVLAAVAVDGGFASLRASDVPRSELRSRLEPPRLALPPEEVPRVLRSGALQPWWSPDVEDALLPIWGVGEDGLARPRLPFQLHMQVVDGLLDGDTDGVLARVTCPAWVVSCEAAPRSPASGSRSSWAADKAAGFERAGGLLAQPRLLRWGGALHDVPLQWPALVSGLIRAAVEEVGRPAVLAAGRRDSAHGGAE